MALITAGRQSIWGKKNLDFKPPLLCCYIYTQKRYKSKSRQNIYGGAPQVVDSTLTNFPATPTVKLTPNVMLCVLLNLSLRGMPCGLCIVWLLYAIAQACDLKRLHQSQYQRTEFWLNRLLTLLRKKNRCLHYIHWKKIYSMHCIHSPFTTDNYPHSYWPFFFFLSYKKNKIYNLIMSYVFYINKIW